MLDKLIKFILNYTFQKRILDTFLRDMFGHSFIDSKQFFFNLLFQHILAQYLLVGYPLVPFLLYYRWGKLNGKVNPESGLENFVLVRSWHIPNILCFRDMWKLYFNSPDKSWEKLVAPPACQQNHLWILQNHLGLKLIIHNLN